MLNIPKSIVLWLVILIGVAMVPASHAQQDELTVTVSVFQIDNSAYPELTAYVSIFERTSLTPILDLGTRNFSATLDDGQALTVEGFVPSTRPIDVMTLLDLTGSVSADELKNQTSAVSTLVGDLNVQDQLGVISMDASTISTVIPLQSNPNLGSLDALQPQLNSEGNVFWDGVYSSLTALQASRPDSKKVLVILTDLTEASAGGTPAESDIITLAVDAGIQVYALHFDFEGDGLPVEGELLPSELTRLTDSTGGITWAVAGQNFGPSNYTDDAALPSMIQTVNRLMQSEFALRLTSPLPANGQRQNLNLALTYQGVELPVLQTYFVTGQPNVVLTFPDLTDPQNISLPFTLRVGAEVESGTLQNMEAVAIGADNQRLPIGPIDPIDLTFTIPKDGLPLGTYQLLVTATDSAGKQFEGQIRLSVVEGLSVTLIDLPQTVDKGQTVTLQARIGMAASVQSVRLLVNGEQVAQQETGPFDTVNLTWQAEQSGEYSLNVIAQDITGNSANQEITLTVGGGNATTISLVPLVAISVILGGLLFIGVSLLRRRSKATPMPSYPDAIPLSRATVPPPDMPIPSVKGQTGPLTDPTATPMMPMPAKTAPSGNAVAELRGDRGEVWYLVEGDNMLGRHSSNTHQLRDESVSRQHAIITVQKRRCTFRDTGASHPSEINGQLLVQGQPYELRDGDRLRLGSTLLTFRKQ